MKNLWRKKGVLMNEVIFIILTVVFFALLLFFVARVASGSSNYEKIYSRKIAYVIDFSKPGMNLSVDISKLFEHSDSNGIARGEIITIDNEKNTVNVHIDKSKGRTYAFFSDYDVLWSINQRSEKLELQIVESGKEQDEELIEEDKEKEDLVGAEGGANTEDVENENADTETVNEEGVGNENDE
ncbi:hypothetical protein GOV14_00800 [Candidatus Pacearchaeota archaeon]|nr:hypothetical protein [Candidatus Pacearchaeota archaeon]